MRTKKRHGEGKDARVAAGCAPPVEGNTRAKRTETKRGKEAADQYELPQEEKNRLVG